MTLLDLDKLCPGVPDGDWTGLLWQFFRYLVEEGELDVPPMERVRQPKTTQKLVPIMGPAT